MDGHIDFHKLLSSQKRPLCIFSIHDAFISLTLHAAVDSPPHPLRRHLSHPPPPFPIICEFYYSWVILSYSRFDSRFAFGFDPTARGRGGRGGGLGVGKGEGWGGGGGLSRHNTAYTRNCVADTVTAAPRRSIEKGKLE